MFKTSAKCIVIAVPALLLFAAGCSQTPVATPAPATPIAPQAHASTAAAPVLPTPTFADVAYGEHPRQKLDFWKAPGTQPTPVVIHMHGGGWSQGDKSTVRHLSQLLAAGISVVSINYRYIQQAQEAGVKPPVEWPMHDAMRALQLVRSKAREWNIQPQHICASGTSAGAATMLWLGLHDDMADPKSADPIARQSTRLWCLAVDDAQTSLDPQQMKEWTPNSRYGWHAYGFKQVKDAKTNEALFTEYLAHRDEVLPWVQQYSPYAQVSRDDPPVFMTYTNAPAMGQPMKDPTHSANFGVKLQEKLESVGVKAELVYPVSADRKPAVLADYLIKVLQP